MNNVNKDMMEMQEKAAAETGGDTAKKLNDGAAAVPGAGEEEEHKFDD
jgi:hypothetical protein